MHLVSPFPPHSHIQSFPLRFLTLLKLSQMDPGLCLSLTGEGKSFPLRLYPRGEQRKASAERDTIFPHSHTQPGSSRVTALVLSTAASPRTGWAEEGRDHLSNDWQKMHSCSLHHLWGRAACTQGPLLAYSRHSKQADGPLPIPPGLPSAQPLLLPAVVAPHKLCFLPATACHTWPRACTLKSPLGCLTPHGRHCTGLGNCLRLQTCTH